MFLVDSHCHLDKVHNLDDYLNKAKQSGVSLFLAIGASNGLDSNVITLEIGKKYPEVFVSLGFHPHEADKFKDLKALNLSFKEAKVVAIGETGLDLHYKFSSYENQVKLFELHIQTAIETKKPLVIHCRDAYSKVVDILKAFKEISGVFHCFTGDKEDLKKILELETFYISVSGIITFKKSENLRFTVKKIPVDRLLIETDAPYLAPAPYRGRICESWMLSETAKITAKLLELELEELARRTTNNFAQLFNLSLSLEA